MGVSDFGSPSLDKTFTIDPSELAAHLKLRWLYYCVGLLSDSMWAVQGIKPDQFSSADLIKWRVPYPSFISWFLVQT
jgi:hypothetical protein